MTGWTVPPGLAFDNHAERLEACVFTVVCDVLDAAVVAAKERIERLYQTDTGEAASRKSPTDTYHLENLPNKGQLFETFFLNPAILKLAERFLARSSSRSSSRRTSGPSAFCLARSRTTRTPTTTCAPRAHRCPW